MKKSSLFLRRMLSSTSSTRRTRPAAPGSRSRPNPYQYYSVPSSWTQPLASPTPSPRSASGFDAILSSISVIQTFDPVHASEGLTMTGRLSRLSTAFADVVAAPCRCSLAAPPSRSRCWACQARRRTCKPPCRRSSKRCPPVSPRHRRVVRKASPLSPKAAGWAGRLAAGQGSWGVVWRWPRQPAGRSLKQACYGHCWQGRSSGRSPAVAALTPLATWIVSAHWPWPTGRPGKGQRKGQLA